MKIQFNRPQFPAMAILAHDGEKFERSALVSLANLLILSTVPFLGIKVVAKILLFLSFQMT